MSDINATDAVSEDLVRDDEVETRSVHRLIEAAAAENLLVVVTLMLGVFLLVIGRTLLGVDSWLTLMAGREIVEHGLPHREVLTTLPAGRTWTDQQWLAQLVFYGLFRVGGLGLAVIFHALMVSTALAVTMIASRMRGASSRMTLVAAIVCLAVAPWSWQLRAQSIALPLFAITLALVATDPRLQLGRTLVVFPALLLWANVHGSVVFGALVVSLAAAFTLPTLRTKPRRKLWRSLAYLVLPWASVFASPYATGLAGYYRSLLVSSPVTRYITEWQAPRPHGYFLVFFAAAVATVVIAVWQRRRLSLYDLAILAITLAGALRSVRAVVWFSLAFAMLLPVALDGFVRPGAAPPVHRRVAAFLAGSVAAVLAVAVIFTLTRSDGWFERGWSAAAARVAAQRVRSGTPAPTVWPSTYGDWLLWKEPSLRGHVGWDARFELLTADQLRAIVGVNAHKRGWLSSMRGFDVLVIDRHHNRYQANALLADPRTHVLYADQMAIVVEQPIR